MSSFSSSQSNLNSNPNFDEHRWLIQIRRTLEEEIEDDDNINVSIFNVPKTLMSNKPDSYIPQQVALGPYHYWRPELYEMGRYKLAAAKRIQKQLQSIKFQNLVENLAKLEPRIRSCYHKYLDFNGETLAWIMAVDASFLLEFLQIYSKNGNNSLRKLSCSKSQLVDYAGRKSTHNVILRDIVMLENQIPLFLLRKMLEFQFSSLEIANEVLNSMLMGLSQELSPFKMKDHVSSIQITACTHLLDFLYNTVVPKSEIPLEIHEQENQEEAIKDFEEEEEDINSSHKKHLFAELWELLSKLIPVRRLKELLLSKPVKLIVKLPWKVISNLPGFSLLKQPVGYLFSSESKEDIKPEDESDSDSKNEKPPLIEEIMIPSVTQLYESGVKFLPTKGDITTISFDCKTVTLYLPTVSLDVNTEVTLRNLVAYEASTASGPLILTRYTEFMNGIIDTEEDAKLLRQKGIVLNRLKSDGEVANLWNGMSQSVSLTKVPFLDKVIEDVNKYYGGRWKVKVEKCLKHYVFGSWKFLTFLAAIAFLLLMILQAFCSVYRCGRIFHITNSE